MAFMPAYKLCSYKWYLKHAHGGTHRYEPREHDLRHAHGRLCGKSFQLLRGHVLDPQDCLCGGNGDWAAEKVVACGGFAAHAVCGQEMLYRQSRICVGRGWEWPVGSPLLVSDVNNSAHWQAPRLTSCTSCTACTGGLAAA